MDITDHIFTPDTLETANVQSLNSRWMFDNAVLDVAGHTTRFILEPGDYCKIDLNKYGVSTVNRIEKVLLDKGFSVEYVTNPWITGNTQGRQHIIKVGWKLD
jgi:hypothetical protein